ncbi:MAG: DUF4232 domain-containing protein, partial [Acidimicrobiales bacterium]
GMARDRKHQWQVAVFAAGVVAVASGCGGGHHKAAATSTPAPASAPTSSTAPGTTAGGATSSTAPGGSGGVPGAATSTTAAPTPGGNGGTCTAAQLRATLGSGQGAAGSVYVPLVLTNSGTSSCSIYGYPGVSYVTSSGGQQVGAAATRSGGYGAHITLAPGDSASATLRQVEGGNYPASECQPTPVAALRVYPPGATAAAFVALPGQTVGCAGNLPAGQSLLSISPLIAGTKGTGA